MTPPRRRAVAVIAAVSAVALTASSCVGSTPEPGPTAATCTSALGAENVTIGWVTDWPGWGYRPEPSIKSGFDFDLAGWLAEELCFRPTMVDVVIDEREDRLLHGDVDLVIAAYSKTDARMEEVSFAAPYVINEQGIMVRADDERITRIDPEVHHRRALGQCLRDQPRQRDRPQRAQARSAQARVVRQPRRPGELGL